MNIAINCHLPVTNPLLSIFFESLFLLHLNVFYSALSEYIQRFLAECVEEFEQLLGNKKAGNADPCHTGAAIQLSPSPLPPPPRVLPTIESPPPKVSSSDILKAKKVSLQMFAAKTWRYESRDWGRVFLGIHHGGSDKVGEVSNQAKPIFSRVTLRDAISTMVLLLLPPTFFPFSTSAGQFALHTRIS